MIDIVIIGGGIAGLYCGYRISIERPDLKFVILEKEKRQETNERVSAGRLGSQMFEGTWVSCGGGIGTEDCKLLLKLLNELKINYNWFLARQKTDNPDDVEWFKNVIEMLKTHCREMNGLTFRDFAREYLSYDEYMRLMYISGYRDYELNDSFHVLTHYGLEDNVDDFRAFSCIWGDLVSALYKKLEGSIHFNREVTELMSIDDNQIVCCNQYKYVSKAIICATAIDGLMQLFDDPVYLSIAGQSELRLYAKIEKSQYIDKVISGHQIIKTKNDLQKIIPITPNIIMVAYCDNLRADMMKKFIEPTSQNKRLIGRLVDDGLLMYLDKFTETKITNMIGFHDQISVHIYKPLTLRIKDFIEKIQNPKYRILVVGEVVALKHGWVESALKSTIPLDGFLKTRFPVNQTNKSHLPIFSFQLQR